MGQGQPQAIDHQKLRSDLRKLHGELRAIKSLDEDEQRMLRLLDSDIEELLARDDGNLQPDPDSRQRLSEALAQVEASHPRVTLLMRQIVDSLAYLGI
jgi:predicted  nucleic acid-binding Zn-ribbon protein